MGTHHLLQHLLETNPKGVFVFASTSETYGNPLEHPQKETYWGNVNPNGVRSCYDEAKRLGETICGVHARDFGMDVRIGRIFNTYGPRMDPEDGRVIPTLLRQALAGEPMTVYGDGTQTRSLCYVDDLIEGFLRLATNEHCAGETLNLGNPNEMTVKEIAEKIKQVTGSASDIMFRPLPQDDPERRCPDISKAKKLLGWEPRVGFEEGMKRLV
jgi:nucleoside-diphosphate-sugar epimerase